MYKLKNYLDDFAVNETFITPGRTITDSDVKNFAGVSGDFHPLHTDITYAEKTPFGKPIAHGMLVLSAGHALAFRLGQHIMLPKSFIAFYGMDKIRFTAPVFFNDTIHLESTVSNITYKNDKMGTLRYDSVIKNQNGVVVISFNWTVACGRKL